MNSDPRVHVDKCIFTHLDARLRQSMELMGFVAVEMIEVLPRLRYIKTDIAGVVYKLEIWIDKNYVEHEINYLAVGDDPMLLGELKIQSTSSSELIVLSFLKDRPLSKFLNDIECYISQFHLMIKLMSSSDKIKNWITASDHVHYGELKVVELSINQDIFL